MRIIFFKSIDEIIPKLSECTILIERNEKLRLSDLNQ